MFHTRVRGADENELLLEKQILDQAAAMKQIRAEFDSKLADIKAEFDAQGDKNGAELARQVGAIKLSIAKSVAKGLEGVDGTAMKVPETLCSESDATEPSVESTGSGGKSLAVRACGGSVMLHSSACTADPCAMQATIIEQANQIAKMKDVLYDLANL